MFLRDAELHVLLDPPSAIIEGLSRDRVTDSKRDPIQPASVDLTIGGIYVPDTAEGKRGSEGHPRDSLSLKPGETAVVETAETCKLPANIGAIGFPPASVSANALLTTNPGHVDPGYHGKLSFTVINMGSENYSLKGGDDIVTLLLFELSANARAPYDVRAPGLHGAVTDDRLNRLAKDFLDINARIRRAVARSERGTRMIGLGVPILAAVVALGGSYLAAKSAHDTDIQVLKHDVASLESEVQNIEGTTALANDVKNLQVRLGALEVKVKFAEARHR